MDFILNDFLTSCKGLYSLHPKTERLGINLSNKTKAQTISSGLV